MEILYEEHGGSVRVWHRHSVEFRSHFHNSVEILCVLSGSCAASADFREYTLGAGDVFLSFPMQIHSYRDLGELDAYLLMFPVTMCGLFSDTLGRCLPQSPVIRAEALDIAWIRTLVLKLNDVNGRSRSPYKQGLLEGYFTSLAGELLPHLELHTENRNFSTEHRIIDYCTGHFREELTLDGVAKALHISKFHVSHVFSAKMKTGFCQFVNSLRLSEACRLLRGGSSITDAALSSGFSSLRTFNRVFRASLGVSPTEYLSVQKKR